MSAELVCSASDPAWLERRREGITATDIVTIAGLVTWDSPWALYHRKLGLLPEVEQSDRMRLGSWLENNLADAWACDRLPDLRALKPGGLFQSVGRIWQMATPDRVIYKRGGTPEAVLECKTSATRQGWGPDGSDEVPASVRAQVLWQMDTLGVGTGHVAVVFLPSGEFRSYTIRHDCPAVTNPAFVVLEACPICQEVDGLRDLGFGFWSRILTKRPPDLDGLEVTTDALRYLHPAPGGQVEINRNFLHAFDAASMAKKLGEDTYREAQNNVRDLMGDVHEATVDGRVVFRRTISKRAGYEVPPGETDTLRRIGKDKDG